VAKAKQLSSARAARKPLWQRKTEDALVESHPEELLRRVHAAEVAIFERLQELAHNSGADDHQAERKGIAEAVQVLRRLKQEKLGFPDWRKK
jgi:hypothetical protein